MAFSKKLHLVPSLSYRGKSMAHTARCLLRRLGRPPASYLMGSSVTIRGLSRFTDTDLLAAPPPKPPGAAVQPPPDLKDHVARQLSTFEISPEDQLRYERLASKLAPAQFPEPELGWAITYELEGLDKINACVLLASQRSELFSSVLFTFIASRHSFCLMQAPLHAPTPPHDAQDVTPDERAPRGPRRSRAFLHAPSSLHTPREAPVPPHRVHPRGPPGPGDRGPGGALDGGALAQRELPPCGRARNEERPKVTG